MRAAPAFAAAPIAALVLAALAGCADFPDLDDKVEPEARSAPFPALIPLDGLALEAAPPADPEATAADLKARAIALRARAVRLRQDAGT